jgi:hypothetical protein
MKNTEEVSLPTLALTHKRLTQLFIDSIAPPLIKALCGNGALGMISGAVSFHRVIDEGLARFKEGLKVMPETQG